MLHYNLYTATKIPFMYFLFWELCGLSSNFHIHVSVSDLYITRIGPHISCGRIGRSIVGIYKSLTDKRMWKLGLWQRNSFPGNICFKFSVLVLCNVILHLGGLAAHVHDVLGVLRNVLLCQLQLCCQPAYPFLHYK